MALMREDGARQPPLAGALAGHLPFYYGWVVLICVCFSAFSRAGPAVATLSIFVEPMTREFGWSRSELSGAVSLGGIIAAAVAPMLGPVLDRRGPRSILCAAGLATGLALAALSLTPSLFMFYALFCIARMNFAGPFDLGIYGAVSNWFLRRRALAVSIANLAEKVGLVALPLLAYFVGEHHGWRSAWLAIGAVVLSIGVLPGWLLIARRPEDVGILDDAPSDTKAGGSPTRAASTPAEPLFTRNEALKTRAFWVLAVFTLMVYPVQAGMSLHLAAHLIERGLGVGAAAASVSTFSGASILATLVFGMLLAPFGVRSTLASAALSLIAAALMMEAVGGGTTALVAAALFGMGVGGIQVVLPVAWANYFGWLNFGAIRGVALAIQVTAQALGPLLSGLLRDWTGNYRASLACFAALSTIAALSALFIKRPGRPPLATRSQSGDA
jgi:sugar phosphate permease